MKEFEFTPTDWVLTRDLNDEEWQLNNFSHKKDEDEFPYHCAGQETGWKQCIPFNDETKHLLDKTDAYKPPYEPKDGDFVVEETKEGKDCPFIFKETSEEKWDGGCYASLDNDGSIEMDGEVVFQISELHCHKDKCRPATEEEKQKLLNALHEVERDWDAERKKVVDYKWKPKNGEKYFTPTTDVHCRYISTDYTFYENDKYDVARVEIGWVFQTRKRCQDFCNKLNEAIKNVK